MIILDKVFFSYIKSENILLENINLKISEKERIGIIGENGCGKSTIIKLVLGILKPNKGKVFIESKESKWLNNHLDLGYLGDPSHKPGNFGLPSDLTVNQILSFQESFFWENHRIELDQDLVDYLELTDLLENKIESLSTGQRKRLMICMSFRKPLKILIADEPFDGLDISIKKKVDVLMNKAINKGVTMLYISHNITEIDKYTEEVFELKKGKLTKVERKKYSVAIRTLSEEVSILKEGEIIALLEQFFQNVDSKNSNINLKVVPVKV